MVSIVDIISISIYIIYLTISSVILSEAIQNLIYHLISQKEEILITRNDVLDFIQEMTKRFREDHININDLMRYRRVDECEEFASEYVQDVRFAAIAKYAVENGGINFSLEDFKLEEDELVNILMFFYCFEDSCNGLNFSEENILSQNAFEELVCKLTSSHNDVESETGTMLGGYYADGTYKYVKANYHIVGSTMEILIDC